MRKYCAYSGPQRACEAARGQKKATEQGHLEGKGEMGAGGDSPPVIAARGPGHTRNSWEPWGSWERWGRGFAWFEDISAHSLSGTRSVTLLCFGIKCLPLKVGLVADSRIYDKKIYSFW